MDAKRKLSLTVAIRQARMGLPDSIGLVMLAIYPREGSTDPSETTIEVVSSFTGRVIEDDQLADLLRTAARWQESKT